MISIVKKATDCENVKKTPEKKCLDETGACNVH